MSKEKFNWKGLFINEEEGAKQSLPQQPEKKESKPRASTTSFPEPKAPISKFPENPPRPISVKDSILTSILELYESGFESLNKPGYDFFEFFKAISAVGSNDPQVYKMALTMAQGVDKKVTKDTLLTEADYYIAEIEKVYKQYDAQGNSKKSQLLQDQKSKKESLLAEITGLEKKLIDIQNQISAKKNELQSQDINIKSEIVEIDQKIMANNAARQKILETIMTVVDGIKNNF